MDSYLCRDPARSLLGPEKMHTSPSAEFQTLDELLCRPTLPPPSVAVYTPIWLPLFALLFSTLIGLISGLYPALRAATMIPVLALKYE